MLKEFKAFAIKGNVVDMAVGVVIGAAFGAIVTSLVNDVMMPPLGLLIGKVDFKEKFIPLSADAEKYVTVKAATDAGAPILKYGMFLNTCINFLIVAFAVFIAVKLISKLLPPPPPPPPAMKDCPQCAMPVPVKAVKCGHCQSSL